MPHPSNVIDAALYQIRATVINYTAFNVLSSYGLILWNFWNRPTLAVGRRI